MKAMCTVYCCVILWLSHIPCKKLVSTVDNDVTLAVLLLSCGLKEKPLVSETECKTVYPHVTYSSATDVFGTDTVFAVFVDNTEVVTCCSIVTSCSLCNWLFDRKYAKSFAAQLSFMDIHIFQFRKEVSS